MAPISMTLSDLEPRFQGHDIIQRKLLENGNAAIFNDLDP